MTSARPSEEHTHYYAGWPGKVLCGGQGKAVTSIKLDDVTCPRCLNLLQPDPLSSDQRVWIALKGNEESLRLAEADGWEVHEVAKAPICRPNSPEDIHQSMNLLQQIHRDSLPSNPCNERFDMLLGALKDMSSRFGLAMDGTVVREAIEQLGALQERCSYYEKDAAAAWDKCEERRLEGEGLRAIAARIRDARERDHWNDLDDAVDALLDSPPSETNPVALLNQLMRVSQGVGAWLLHRFGPDSPEGREAQTLLDATRQAVGDRPALKANACRRDPNPSIGGSPACPVHDGESEPE